MQVSKYNKVKYILLYKENLSLDEASIDVMN